MHSDNRTNKNQSSTRENCRYQPAHARQETFDTRVNECSCMPAIDQEQCRCSGLSYVKASFVDQGKPGVGLQAAMNAVNDADGLIASNLNRFVEHYSFRLRDLRSFVHHFFCHSAKHLITVEEGVDTGSAQGQANVVEVMNQVKELY